jgi:hypothetical protein
VFPFDIENGAIVHLFRSIADLVLKAIIREFRRGRLGEK